MRYCAARFYIILLYKDSRYSESWNVGVYANALRQVEVGKN